MSVKFEDKGKNPGSWAPYFPLFTSVLKFACNLMIFSNLGFQPCMYKAFAKYALNVHAQRCNLSFSHICLEFDFP